MTIVTKNSLTLSNVNDGTITHTAYAYSADGKDRFTNVYPRKNFIRNSDFRNGLDNWTGDTSKFIISQESGDNLVTVTVTGQNNIGVKASLYGTTTPVKTNDYIIVSGWFRGKDIETKSFFIVEGYDSNGTRVQFNDIATDTAGLIWSTPVTNNTWSKFYLRWKITNANVVSAGFRFVPFNNGTYSYKKFKLEADTPDGKATPWIPSASEATTADYPAYIGQYTDFTQTDSTNPSDYTWSLIRGNDGQNSYTHTAYSWSADGTDGFTTIYPNLNLLDFNSGVTLGKHYGWAADTTTYSGNRAYFKKVKVTPNNQYTISANWLNTSWLNVYGFANESDTVAVARYGSGNGQGTGFWDSSFVGGFTVAKNMTFTVPANVNYIGVSYCGVSTDTLTLQALLNGKPKLEKGSISTPWMPSSSEVKTSDYPNYIGTYSDSNVESSLDYSKYQWAIFKGQNSNAYTAYSWSSDGSDRFTTAYPSLNLLKGTKTPISITGNNTANQGGLLFPFDNDKTLANQGFNINDILTLEFDWSATNPASGTFILQWQGTPWDLKVPTIKLSSTNGSGHVIHTYNIRAMDIASTAYATGIGYRLDNIPTNTVITFSNVIIRKAKGSQPWMPSESEFQDQWQDAIPMYVGLGEKDSQNPSDYRWQLNPRYVQASSDNGLSSKAGIDDLASVGNTANDALVQAQNAVSNEDYTSWLEHDYQNTIDNLQEISAQNQDDIKNVDDRTTIVEGFYGEMKVKWNFIDESFSFSEEGMFISNAQSKMSIQITSDKIVFWDNNVDVAFITGEVLNIQKGVFLESATIGNHLITKFSDDSPVTIIRYVGGIT